MQRVETLKQYYNERGVQVTDSFHPLTPAANYVIGIFSDVPHSKLKRSCHAIVICRGESEGAYNILNMNAKTKGTYGFPGGGMEGNESPRECVQREIVEELGFAPYQYQLITLGYLATKGCHFPIYLIDITGQIPMANEICGSTHIAITLLEGLYRYLPSPAQNQVKRTIDNHLTSPLVY